MPLPPLNIGNTPRRSQNTNLDQNSSLNSNPSSEGNFLSLNLNTKIGSLNKITQIKPNLLVDTSKILNLNSLGNIKPEINRDLIQQVVEEVERRSVDAESLEDSINPVIDNQFNNDISYEGHNFSNDFVLKNLISVIGNSNKLFDSLVFPNILSHEIIKVNYRPLLKTNESSLLPSMIYNLKEEYFTKVQKTNATSYFIYSENSKNIREDYISELSETRKKIDDSYTKLEEIIDLKEKSNLDHSYGNKLSRFYLNESASSSIGKIASYILDNSQISFFEPSKNDKNLNSLLSSFFYTSSVSNFDYFEEEEKNKIFDLMITQCDSKTSFFKVADDQNILLNTDKLIGQNLLNTSISLNGFYKDSLSYKFWKEKHVNSSGSYLNSVIDSYQFLRLPILKLESILSIETNSNALFNCFNYDEIEKLNDSVFNLSSVSSSNFDPYFKFKKDTKGKISSINRKTFTVFGSSLYLTNALDKNTYYFNKKVVTDSEERVGSFKSSIINKEQIIETGHSSTQTSDFEVLPGRSTVNYRSSGEIGLNIELDRLSDVYGIKYLNKYINPFRFSKITKKKRMSGNYQYATSSYISDINFLYHDLETNKQVIKLAEEKNDFFKYKSAKSILNCSKFLFFVGREDHENFNKEKGDYTQIKSDFEFNGIDLICLDTSKFLKNNKRQSIRKFIKDDSIQITNSLFKDYYQSENSKNSILENKTIVIEESANFMLDTDNDEFTVKSAIKGIVGISEEDFLSNSNKYKYYEKYFKPEEIKVSLKDVTKDMSLTKGFALFKNTQNEMSIYDMSDKFINFNANLTKENEFMNDRLVSSSSSFNQSQEENTELITDQLKKYSLKNTTWEKTAFQIKNSLFEIKKKKLERAGETNFLNYLKDFKAKTKKVKKIDRNYPYLTLLYSDSFENSIDKLENSDFIINDLGRGNFKKFNFSFPQEGIKNSFEFYSTNQNEDANDFGVNKNDVKRFLSLFYTDSELKSSAIFYKHCLKNITKIFKNSTQLENNNKFMLGFDKLLSDAILEKNSSDFYKALIISAIISEKRISSPDNFNSLNEKTESAYEKYIESVYSFKNVQKQKSFTLRTVDFPDINVIKNNDDRSTSSFDPGQAVLKNYGADLAIDGHQLDFGVMPGQTFTLSFPFITSSYNHKIHDTLSYCSAYKTSSSKNYGGGFLITDRDRFLNQDAEEGSFEGLYEFVHSNFYNYDSYLDNSQDSLGENKVVENVAFNFENNEAAIFNIHRVGKGIGDFSINRAINLRTGLTNLTKTIENIESESPKEFSSISKSLSYKRWGLRFKDYSFYNLDNQPRFKSFINTLIIEILKFIDNNFEDNFTNIQTLEQAVEYSKTFESCYKYIFDLLKFPSNLYSSIFDITLEASMLASIEKYLEEDSPQNYDYKDLWRNDVYDLFGFEKLVSNNSKFKFEKTVQAEDSEDFKQNLYVKMHADLSFIDRTLNNSDILEIMSFDNFISFLNEFEKFKNNRGLFLQVQDKISFLEENLNVSNIFDIICDDVKLNIVSKRLNDYSYYQEKEYIRINQKINSDLSLDLKNIFEDLITNTDRGFFETELSREIDKSKLAFQGISLLNLQSLKYDIIRFGIDFGIANLLKDNKILKFKCHITNHKYPNIFIPPIFKFYTPVLTNITPSHLKIIENISSNISSDILIDDFIGIYDNSKNNLKERYNIVSLIQAVAYVRDILLSNVNNERMFRNEELRIDLDSVQATQNAFQIVSDSIMSSAVKYSNYRTNKKIDEDNIIPATEDFVLLKDSSASKFEAMSVKDFEETFSESYSSASKVFSEENELSSRLKIVEKQAKFIDFFNQITQYTGSENISSIFEDTRFYDVFSIVISREQIKSNIENYYKNSENPDSVYILREIEKEGFFDSFSFVFEAEVV